VELRFCDGSHERRPAAEVFDVVDEFTRECLAIFVGRRIGALE
jgi:hypothetical protein